MDLSDVQTAPTPTLLLVHVFIVEVLWYINILLLETKHFDLNQNSQRSCLIFVLGTISLVFRNKFQYIIMLKLFY